MHATAETTLIERQRNKLAEQTWEIATLTLLVRDIEALNEELVVRERWFSDITLLLASQPAWRWMPKAARARLLKRRLADHKLFDSDAYLTRYPDVAAAGVDPLSHYIRHGMAEGRER